MCTDLPVPARVLLAATGVHGSEPAGDGAVPPGGVRVCGRRRARPDGLLLQEADAHHGQVSGQQGGEKRL